MYRDGFSMTWTSLVDSWQLSCPFSISSRKGIEGHTIYELEYVDEV